MSNKITHYHYLVIDDDGVARDMIARWLKREGATRVDVADDGRTAMRQINTSSTLPDIIICDLNMPGLDGVEFVRYLAQKCFLGGLVLMSGSDKVILDAVRKMGQARFLRVLGTLPKPFLPEMLLACLQKYEKECGTLPPPAAGEAS